MYGIPKFLYPVESLAKKNKMLFKTTFTIYSKYVRRRIQLINWYNYGRHHSAPVRPFQTIYVCPDDIKYDKKRRAEYLGENYLWYSHVLDGDWDKNNNYFKNNYVYVGLKEHFKYGVSWEETKFFNKWKKRINKGNNSSRAVSSYEDILDRCKKIENLYEDIDKGGFKSHKELYETGIAGPLPDDIAIRIGRDGELIYERGKHRLSIAKLLGLQKIPVRVVIRHKNWQQIRNKFVDDGEISQIRQNIIKYRSHPDIEYL